MTIVVIGAIKTVHIHTHTHMLAIAHYSYSLGSAVFVVKPAKRMWHFRRHMITNASRSLDHCCLVK